MSRTQALSAGGPDLSLRRRSLLMRDLKLSMGDCTHSPGERVPQRVQWMQSTKPGAGERPQTTVALIRHHQHHRPSSGLSERQQQVLRGLRVPIRRQP